jgi:signal transduction histidine kinase
VEDGSITNLIIPDRRAFLGGLVGAGIAALSAAMTDDPDRLPYTVLLVMAIALIGLALGAKAALWAFLVGTVVTIVPILLAPRDEPFMVNEVVRLATFLLGSPLIVFLVYRSEVSRDVARTALGQSHAAQAETEAERQRVEAARREVDAALADTERERTRLGEVAESIPEPLIVYDPDQRSSYGNRAALRLFGRSFVERPVEAWDVAEPRDEHGAPLDPADWPQVRAIREPVRRRMVLRIPMTGRDITVDLEGTPIPGGGAVLLLRDIGKEEDQRRRLSRFASFVAHELRNPLAVAKARIELAQRDPQLPRRAAGHSTRALESVDAAIGILERLELYSRADSGRVEASRETFVLAPALGAAIERLRTRGSEREVRVAIDPGTSVVGDRHLTEQAITNLLTNADRYSHPGAPIHVDVQDGAAQVTLRVRDEGPGISDEVAERLFHDRVAAGRGLGLGLYLVRATMEAMGGSVQLERRRPTAVFALRWARAEAGAADEPLRGDLAREA